MEEYPMKLFQYVVTVLFIALTSMNVALAMEVENPRQYDYCVRNAQEKITILTRKHRELRDAARREHASFPASRQKKEQYKQQQYQYAFVHMLRAHFQEEINVEGSSYVGAVKRMYERDDVQRRKNSEYINPPFLKATTACFRFKSPYNSAPSKTHSTE
jgi:hypothetical protein